MPISGKKRAKKGGINDVLEGGGIKETHSVQTYCCYCLHPKDCEMKRGGEDWIAVCNDPTCQYQFKQDFPF